MNESKTTDLAQFQKLKALRDHLIDLDSGSGDAKVLTWAIGTIQKAAQARDILVELKEIWWPS